MVILFGCLSLLVSCLGIYSNYKKKNLILYIWVICAYYCITSLVAINSPQNIYIMNSTKIIYMFNLLSCIASFYVCDLLFNKKNISNVSFSFTHYEKIFKILELIYWISYILTFLELRTLDYWTYVSQGGAGWAQVFYISTSGVIYYYCYKKKWLKISISLILMLLIIASTGVRSLLYYIVMPIGFYYLHKILHTSRSIGGFIMKILPFAVLLIISVLVVNMLRFGYVDLPETELTIIALRCLEYWNEGNQYFNSVNHYMLGFLVPINNIMTKFDIYWLDYMDLLFPSIPKLNALILLGATDVSQIGATHMPSTIFYNLYISWGNYAFIASFVTYWFFLKFFSFFQANNLRILLFSPMFGWHFYMIMRGASDGASRGIAYSILICLIIYYIIFKRIKN